MKCSICVIVHVDDSVIVKHFVNLFRWPNRRMTFLMRSRYRYQFQEFSDAARRDIDFVQLLPEISTNFLHVHSFFAR